MIHVLIHVYGDDADGIRLRCALSGACTFVEYELRGFGVEERMQGRPGKDKDQEEEEIALTANASIRGKSDHGRLILPLDP